MRSKPRNQKSEIRNEQLQVTVIHQDRLSAAIQSEQRNGYCHPEPLPLDEAEPFIDVRATGSGIQQVQTFIPQAGSGNHREIFGRTLISHRMVFIVEWLKKLKLYLRSINYQKLTLNLKAI